VSEVFSIRAEEQDGRQNLLVGHFLDREQMLVENVFEAVPALKLRNDIALAKLKRLPQSRCK